MKTSIPDDSIPDDLAAALTELAAAGSLLVATDYDGVVAPLVSNPADAKPAPGTMEVLAALADLPATAVALVSGRDLATLRLLSGAPSHLTTVGSHGAEFEDGFEQPIGATEKALLQSISTELDAIAANTAGATVERKPISVALHIRNADPVAGEAALAAARSGPGSRSGVQITEGKAVIELAVIETSKGVALLALKATTGSRAIYFGDDVTDEKAFAALGPGDVTVKVGAGDTLAQYRVPGPAAVTAALKFLLTQRAV